MKKLTLCLAMLLLLCGLTACGSADRPADIPADTQADSPNVLSTVVPTKAEVPEKERTFPVPVYGNTRIRLSWGEGKEIVVRLIDNDATADLVSKLPVSLPFEDYRGFQRDAILDLDPGTSPSQCDVFTGDFAYYDPWSHLTFFCEDFGYSRDLTPLGTIESGLEYLESINDGSEVLIELVEEKNLIVYFSRWGNTDYPDNVDANSSASIVLNGDDQYGITEYIARLIQQNAGGNLHLIQTVKPYPTDFDAVVDQNVKEMADGTLPQLVKSDLDISEYDTIFIGYPIWAMAAPQPIFSFLKEYDLSGKTVVPFCTHHGYGAGRSYQNIADAIPGAETLDGFAIDGDKLENAEAETVQWLQTVGLMRGKVNEVAYTTPDGETGYLYLTDEILAHPEKKVPLVLAMCGTGHDTRKDAADMGWVDLARNGEFIVLAPNYHNGSTYSETDTIASVVEYITENYPVDAARVYSTGFSNGGALSVALCRDYPQLFAGIAAFGWMVDMPDRNGVYAAYDMPFQLIQGTAEYTYKTNSGAMAVMRDEQQALRALFRMNEMITQSARADYAKVPYWGYEPDETHTLTRGDREWQFSDYYKDGYTHPFAQLVLIEGAEHTPHQYEAQAAWQFLKQYSRNEKGEIVAVEPQTR